MVKRTNEPPAKSDDKRGPAAIHRQMHAENPNVTLEEVRAGVKAIHPDKDYQKNQFDSVLDSINGVTRQRSPKPNLAPQPISVDDVLELRKVAAEYVESVGGRDKAEQLLTQVEGFIQKVGSVNNARKWLSLV